MFCMKNDLNSYIERMRKEPQYGKGLFQTDLKCGFIYAVITKNGKPTFDWGTPVHNDCRGENVALEMMKQKGFISWAKDPWTGEDHLIFPRSLLDFF